MNPKAAPDVGPVVRPGPVRPQATSPLFRFILPGAVLVGLMAYALSYAALYELARAHHFAGPFTWQAIAWPFTVDVASLMMFLLGLDAARRSGRRGGVPACRRREPGASPSLLPCRPGRPWWRWPWA